MTPSKPVRGLGRGLDALLGARPAAPPARQGESYGDGNVFSCGVEKLAPQRGQPRQHFDTVALDGLANSIKEHGLLEPLVVRRVPDSDRFEIVAGERRWRAAQRAGLHEVLVVVRDVSAAAAYELALIENVQREDLNPIEFAEALGHLMSEHGYTQDTLAQRIGKDRSTIANALRLLKLPEKTRAMVIAGELSEGHARALLGAQDAETLVSLAEKVAHGRLSVRQTESLVRASKPAARPGATPVAKSASVRDLETRLSRKLGTPCRVRDRKGRGVIVVRYSSLDELDRLLELLL